MADGTPATTLQLIGAGCFGLILGWYLYFINRYRTGAVDFGDIITILGAIGGAAVTALFRTGSDLFGAYGIGLAVGFFLYYAILNTMVARSPNFDSDFFLDGRRKRPVEPFYIPEGWRSATSSGMDQTFQAGGPVNPPAGPGAPPAGPR
jgi:hypothetical protein